MKTKIIFLLLPIIALFLALSTAVYGYWVDQVQTDSQIALKRNITIEVTGLTPSETDPEEQSDLIEPDGTDGQNQDMNNSDITENLPDDLNQDADGADEAADNIVDDTGDVLSTDNDINNDADSDIGDDMGSDTDADSGNENDE